MTSKYLIRLLEKNGWYEESQKGSHKKFAHPNKKIELIVPYHSKDMKPGTLHAILKKAGLDNLRL